jgi:uncharacterized membrane protein YdbT with pleckstrin-like domain
VAFPPKLLNEGEEVVLDLKPHWWYMAEPTAALLAGIVLIALALALADGEALWEAWVKGFTGLLVLVCVVWFLVRWARWVTTNFVVTTDRVLFRRGLIAKSGVEIPLDKINTVFFNQSIFERMLGAGDLRIESAGERGTEQFSDVRKPSIVQNEIYKQMEANENRKFDRINDNRDSAPAAPPVTQPAPGTDSIPEQIEALDDLRKRGAISEEEFAAKKAELLKRM